MLTHRLLTLLPLLAYISIPDHSPEMSAAGPMAQCTHINSYSGSSGYILTTDDVDVAPCFPGGDSARLNYINANRLYPADDFNNGVQGRVVCSFVVNADGSISDAAILKGVSKSLNDEALRLINSMPDWVAGQLDGKSVPVYQVMSISFR
ncbi:MAG: energy transducer TonB, partial [Muribaculaceae bacterium]|nr:energy transducer TonB [Muribaculaceae bacterium]